jgi:glycosyltransferase involved in cell wall biosynthesis
MEDILVIEDSSKSKFGGGQRVTLDFINTMRGINKNLYVIDHGKNKETEFKNEIKKLQIKLFEVYSFGKIENKPLSSYSFSISESLLYPFFLAFNYFQIITDRELRKILNNDLIIYCATKKAFFLTYLISKKTNKIVFHAHNINKKNIFSFFLNYYLNKPNVNIISVSNTVKSSYNISKIKTIYNGVNLNSFCKTRVDTNKIIRVAFVGSLITWKGVDVFLNSINYQTDSTHYYIYGSGVLFVELSEKWAHDKRIHFKGFMNDLDLSYKNEIDILCLPSLDSEACPMSIIEAFSYAIPVITTNIGGQAELVTNDSGILVDVNSPIGISNAVDLIASNYKFYSNNAVNNYRRFKMSEFKKSITEFILNI